MITTARLQLVAMTPALAAAELASVASLAAVLDVEPPGEWPPEFYEADDLERMRLLVQDPANAGWALYYLVRQADPRTLVGVAGFAGRPTAEGVVEIGYSILRSHRRLGFASEALAALLEHAFREPSVAVVAGETFPELDGSIGVLMQNGFRLSTAPARGNVLRFELSRSAFSGAT